MSDDKPCKCVGKMIVPRVKIEKIINKKIFKISKRKLSKDKQRRRDRYISIMENK